jgi:hypothetical protein
MGTLSKPARKTNKGPTNVSPNMHREDSVPDMYSVEIARPRKPRP